MPDWRDNEVKDNIRDIRDGFAQSNNLNINTSNRKLRHELASTPTNDFNGTHKTTNHNAFGVITNKPFENGTSSMSRDSVENGRNDVSCGENDLGYYDWPAIDNFEDVDKLFRNCDSTFGQTQAVEDGGADLSWFPTSSDAMYTSEMETLNELSAYSSLKPGPHTSADAEVEDALVSCKMECEGEEREEAVNQTYNGSSLTGFEPLDMIRNPHMSVENITQDLVDQDCSLISPPSEMSNSPFVPNQRESCSSNYLTFNSYPGMESTPPVEPVGQKVSSMGKKVEKLKNGQLMNSIQQHFDEKPSYQGPNCKSQYVKGTSEQKSILDSSMVVNGSPNEKNSSFSANDPSVEETSFRRLQDVMNQLDVKTKLCIRDGLYRLARSVQQRNGYSNANSSYGNGDAPYSSINDRFAEPLDSETGTNPIDRSIAELLFQQLPGPTRNPGPPIRNIEETASLKSLVSSEHKNHAPGVVVSCNERQGHISSDRNSTKN